MLNLTFSGAVFGPDAVVAVTYHAPLSSSDPQLQGLGSLTTAGFGPVTVPIV
ncbi:MAG TPA: hypothetical protein VFX16_18005 [Pseudonocardiaceae bacterium]|nr:hypothetical protein [Pseudonocardiaceae bacterium]